MSGVYYDFKLIQDIIIGIRNARSENRVEPATKIKAVIYAGEQTELIKSQAKILIGLRTGLADLEVKPSGNKIENAIYLAVGGIEVYLLGARDEAKERARLDKEIVNLTGLVKNMKVKLANEEFVAKAPPAVIEKERTKLAGWESELKKLTDQLTNQ
jgi:valyl-tRNA synthetase